MTLERPSTQFGAQAERSGEPGIPAESASGRYRSSAPPRWISFLIVAAIHIAGFYGLATFNVIVLRKEAEPPLVMVLVSLPEQAPPSARRKKELPVKPLVTKSERSAGLPPIMTLAPALPANAVPEKPPTSQPATESPPQPAQSAPIAVDSLAAKLISAPPPRYPIESRRKREMGTVILLVTVGENGHVEAIVVHESSGFEHLDRAALGAVRQWRWLPTTLDGQAVRVRGLVRIPFELRI